MKSAVVVMVLVLLAGCQTPAGNTGGGVAYLGGLGIGAEAASLAGVPALTIEELDSCGRFKWTLKQSRDSLWDASRQLEIDQIAIDDLGLSIEQDRAGVDATDGLAVDAFNRRVTEHRTQVREFNVAVDEYNFEGRQFQKRVDRFNVDCSRRPFRENDLESIEPLYAAILLEDSKEFDLPTARIVNGSVVIGR